MNEIIKIFVSQTKLVSNVLVTGSLSGLPGMQQRLEADLRAARPFGSTFKVRVAQNPQLDAW